MVVLNRRLIPAWAGLQPGRAGIRTHSCSVVSIDRAVTAQSGPRPARNIPRKRRVADILDRLVGQAPRW